MYLDTGIVRKRYCYWLNRGSGNGIHRASIDDCTVDTEDDQECL